MSSGEVSSVTGELKQKIEAPFLFIRISKQPPPHVFSGEWFDVAFDLSSSFPPDIPPESIELCANLHPNINGVSSEDPVRQNKDVEVHLAIQSDLIGVPDGQAIVKCRIKSPSVKQGMPISYNLKFFQRMRESGAIIEQVEGALSNKVQIVSYKLSLECNWGSFIFYKDEGGKDKHLPTIARLIGADGNIVKGIHVPLKVSLIYDNEEGSSVLQEEKILRLLETTKHYIDPDSGLSIIKFRIEDVSKNHQGLKFKLVVFPFGNRSVNVGFAITPGISVRSKRNKRTLTTALSSPSRKKAASQQSVVSPGSLIQGESVDGGGVGSTLSSPNRDYKNFDSPSRNIDMNFALTQVSDWAKEVSHILPTLNWTLIGYCQNVDGSVDYTKPNHLMPYPNDCVKRLMKSYSTNIFQCLEVLQGGLDRGLIANSGNSTHIRRESDQLQHPKTIEPCPQIHQSPNIESPKNVYRDYTNILPIPLNQMSPMATLPGTHQNQVHNNNGARRRSGSWNKNIFNNNNSSDYNGQLKQIDFIYAKHLLSSSGEKLGFPVCDINNELVGFFKESEVGEPRFFPISTVTGFDQNQKTEVKKIVEEAVNQRSDAIHRLKDYGTLASLFDHVMVYDWSREFSQHT